MKKTFEYDRSFQEKIVQAMLLDRQWAAQFAEVVNVDFFEFGYLHILTKTYLEYYKKYKEFPTTYLLAQIISTELKNGSDAALKDQIRAFLKKMQENNDLCDLGYIKDKSLDFCKRAGLQKALEESVELIVTEKYEKVVDVIKAAISAGEAHSSGLELGVDIDARYSETYRKTIPTGIPELDQKIILNGGLGSGELGIVVAASSVGKTHCLVQFGAGALKVGKNVLHYTFELNERAVGIRYDSHLLDIDSLDCYEAKDKIKQYYDANAENLGRLKIKYYPTGTATIQTFRNHIDKLSLEGFIPDLIIVDYAGIMRSTEKFELLRLELKKICEELRAFANELDVPLWTALQSNKEGANQEYVDLTNLAEAYGQAAVADFVLGLSRKSGAAKVTGYGKAYIAKCRAGRDGILYNIHLDTTRSKLRVVSDTEYTNNMNLLEENEKDGMRSFLRTKIRDLQQKENNASHIQDDDEVEKKWQ